MKRTALALTTIIFLTHTLTGLAQSADLGNIIKAQVILGQISQLASKYEDVQALLDQGTLELEVVEPLEDNSGDFMFPFTRDGEMTAWADKALNAQIGSRVAGEVADRATNALAARVPLGGLASRFARSKAQETGAVMAIGGWEFIRENSELSFTRLDDLSVYMHSRFNGDLAYEQALAAAMAVYPELEKGHEKAVDKAYRDARREARRNR
tara:strand:- start:187587 stop:188219 length:633 start_codon:yes stop_codon:yes gene_type:complete